MKNFVVFSITTGALLFGTTQAQAATMTTTIDNFNEGELVVEAQTTSPVATASQESVVGVFGGSRNVTVEIIGSGTSGAANAKIDFETTSNLYVHNNDDRIDSSVNVLYDGFGQIDLSSMGERFVVDVESYGVGETHTAGVSVTDSNGNTDSQNVAINALGATTFDFADFSGIDFTSVTGITLQTESFDEDMSLDNFRIEGEQTLEQTPEPAAVIGLLVSLGFGALFKKKKPA